MKKWHRSGTKMSEKFFPSKYKGVRYREHATRKNGIRKDRYFIIRYKLDGKTKSEGFGWESEGYPKRANRKRVKMLKIYERLVGKTLTAWLKSVRTINY